LSELVLRNRSRVVRRNRDGNQEVATVSIIRITREDVERARRAREEALRDDPGFRALEEEIGRQKQEADSCSEGEDQ
jgi:hypothetical protein